MKVAKIVQIRKMEILIIAVLATTQTKDYF